MAGLVSKRFSSNNCQMKNQGSTKIFDVHMIQNSRPVGKAFKRKKASESFGSTEKFTFRNDSKMGSLGSAAKQSLGDEVGKKIESNRKFGIKRKVISENEEKMLKNNKLQLNSQSALSGPVQNKPNVPQPSAKKKFGSTYHKHSKSNFPVTGKKKCEESQLNQPNLQLPNKRKFNEAGIAAPTQSNKKVKGLKPVDNVNNQGSASSIKVTPSDENVCPQNKKRKNKKKKKKNSESTDSGGTQYQPVLVVKGANDISANWKNLKEIITKCDREQAVKKELKGKSKKVKQKSKFIKQRSGKQYDGTPEEKDKESLSKQTSKQKKQKKSDIWFDNVDPILLGEEYEEDEESQSNEAVENGAEEDEPVKGKDSRDSEEKPVDGNTKAVAMDCEMVGVGINGVESMLARVTIVNQHCKVIYDKFVKPQEVVVDYRTEFSGIRPEDIRNGHDFKTVQQEVASIIKDKTLVGHGLDNDLKALFLRHPRSRIRDTARYKPFRTMFRGYVPKLKMLANRILGVAIQTGEHDSGQDAQAAMRIYTVYRKEWESAKKKAFQLPKKKAKKEETSPGV